MFVTVFALYVFVFVHPCSEPDIEQSEDCLYLSVFMPHTTDINPRIDQSRDELFDVIVYFHGGAYGRGSKENIDGARLALDQNFIVVSVSFRLGPFGFWVYSDKKGFILDD